MDGTAPATAPVTGRARRVVEVVALVAVWMALGRLLPVDANGYLLLGIPLTLAFQLLVRRRPVRELWVRDGDRFALDRLAAVVAAVLLVVPAVMLVLAVREGAWVQAAWYLAAVVGAVAAGYALRRTTPGRVLRAAALPAAIGVLIMVLNGVLQAVVLGRAPAPLAMLGTGLLSLALYFPVSFLIEEVAFRGALDAHVHRPGEGRGWWTALLTSALWGLWHLPVLPPPASAGALAVSVVQLLAVHCAIGVPLAFAWRRTGNLAAPALAHSLADAVRNAFAAGLA
jgi:membrane protease YdiL (CAAX protease family)